MDADNWEPSEKLTYIITIGLWSIKDEILKEMWYIAPISKIQRVVDLQFTLDEWKFKTTGELDTELALEGILDCCRNSRTLLYFSWVKPYKVEVETDEGTLDPSVTVVAVWELVPWNLLLPLKLRGNPYLMKQVAKAWFVVPQCVQTRLWPLEPLTPWNFPLEWLCLGLLVGVPWDNWTCEDVISSLLPMLGIKADTLLFC